MKAKEIRNSLITAIPGITFKMVAIIQAEIGDFNRFSSPDKILAFAGLSPTTYQSGKFTSQNAVMEKRGSRYLYSLTSATYLRKKREEGKHHYVVLSHVAKKLV